MCSWGPKHLWAAMAGGEALSVEQGALGTAPLLPHTHLLRRMIWNSGLCRLVTDT